MAAVQDHGRPARNSLSGIRVDMAGIIPTVQQLAVQSRRFFRKKALPAEETFVRVLGKKGSRLPVVVASMLRFSTKEERYGAILIGMGFPGRAAVPKATPLSAASLHEFSSAGLSAGRPQLAARWTVSSSAGASGTAAEEASGALAPGGDHLSDMSCKFASMAVLLQKEGVAQESLSRALRVQARREKRRPPTHPPALSRSIGAPSSSPSMLSHPPRTRRPHGFPSVAPQPSPTMPLAAGSLSVGLFAGGPAGSNPSTTHRDWGVKRHRERPSPVSLVAPAAVIALPAQF